MKTVSKLLLILILLISCTSVLSAEDNETDNKEEIVKEEEKLVSLTEDRRETLKYGIDSEIITLIDSIKSEEDPIFAEDVARVYSESNNAEIMNAAVDYFIVIEFSDAVDIASARIENWEDESFNNLSVSLRYLSAFPQEDSEDIIFPLVDHDTISIASSALTAIGKCGTEKSVDPLLDLLDDDEYHDELKPTIIRALGNIGSEQSLDILIDILEDIDEEKSWRWNACEALGKIGNSDALPSIKLALQDPDTYLRSFAVKALASFPDDDVEETLIQSLKDSFWRVRVSAAEALGEMKSKEAVDILIYKARKDPENNVKIAAVEALGDIADRKSLDFLKELYKKSNTAPSVRTKSAQIIIENDIEGSLAVIVEVLDQEWEKDNSSVLSYTCQFLSKTESPKLEALFERMLGHNEVAIKIYGIRGIQLNKFSGMKERLETLTDEKMNTSVRKAALGAIEQL